MTDSQIPVDPGELYAELERVYTLAQWDEVLSQGSRLLALLDGGPEDPSRNGALRSRCLLLLGHANLYGLQRPALARPYYKALQQGTDEPDLRRQAEDALRYCPPNPADQVASRSAGGMGETPAPAPAEPLAQSGAAGSEMDPQAATVRQPEAAASLLEPFAPSLIEPVPGTASAPGMDPFLAAVAAAGAAASAAKPAVGAPMPWLEDSGGAPPAAEPATQEAVAAAWPVGAEHPSAGALAPPRLEVEVVEEPELIEVVQADPSLAEELQIELERIRARRRAESAAGRTGGDADVPEAASSHPPRLSLVKESPTAEPSAMRPSQPEAVRPRPVDLSSEDPELVAGLLQVVLQG